jgi:outer membrane immunogenic protein
MRRTFSALFIVAATAAGLTAASAADLPVVRKAPPVAVVAGYNWSGAYIGGHVGYGWGRARWTDVTGAAFVDPGASHDTDGWFAGGQIGVNWQRGNFVFGLEGEGAWADIEGDGLYDPAGGRDPLNVRTRWLAAATGRLGYANGPWLVYAKGGAAWAGNRYSITFAPLAGQPTSTVSDTVTGWTAGGGVEHGLSGNWSVKLEYAYYRFDNDGVSFPGVTGFATLPSFPQDIDQHIHTVKFGVNYRFTSWR